MSAPLLSYDLHEGEGSWLLLVHGMLASRAQWLPNLEALATVSRPVVVELLGHGRSPSPEDPEPYRPESYVEEFERIRRVLGAEDWLICGQSLGAALTLRYALDHPDRVRGHVFTNSNSALAEPEWSEAIRSGLREQARRLEAGGRKIIDEMPIHPGRSRHTPPDVRDALVADCALHDPRGVVQTLLYTVPDSPVRGRVGKNRVPSLLVVGEREAQFAPHARFAEEAMPSLEVVRLDAGHAVNLQAAKGFNDAVARFVRAQAGVRRPQSDSTQ
jgi:pimeloyl-ACP methyl ester carboxylesterase